MVFSINQATKFGEEFASITLTLKEKKKMVDELSQKAQKIFETTVCVSCKKPSEFPKVLGSCGHITCTKCVPMASSNSLPPCPACKTPTSGLGLPVLELNRITQKYLELNQQLS